MDKLITFVILALSFNAVFMIQAQVYAQNVTVTDDRDDIVTSITALIVAIGTLVGTIGSIIGVVVVFIKNKQTKEIATQIGVGMSTFGQKTVENTDRIRNLTRASVELSPEEARKFLAGKRQDIDQLTESVKRGTEQLKTIEENLPKPTMEKIKMVKNGLPQESFDTRPEA
jgi:hypothetical protein